MASGRRGPPDFKGTLGTLLRTTLEQAGALRDAAWRQARSQRGWAGGVMLERQRRDLLASLGELVYELAAAGELGDLEDFPEIERAIAELEALDRDLAEQQSDRREVESALGPGASRGPSSRPRQGRSERGEVRVWRPNVDDAPELNPDPPEETAGEPPVRPAERPRGRRPARRAGRRAARPGGGGIAFVDDGADDDEEDADLKTYMHEQDVPDESDAT